LRSHIAADGDLGSHDPTDQAGHRARWRRAATPPAEVPGSDDRSTDDRTSQNRGELCSRHVGVDDRHPLQPKKFLSGSSRACCRPPGDVPTTRDSKVAPHLFRIASNHRNLMASSSLPDGKSDDMALHPRKRVRTHSMHDPQH
jgi:hypothetical protein